MGTTYRHNSVSIILKNILIISTLILFIQCQYHGEKNRGKDFDLQGFINKEIAKGNKTITIPPGIYRITPQNQQHLYLKDLSDISIIADDVEMICTETTRAITFENCKNISLKGMTIDYDPLCFTQGVITKLAPDKSYIEFKLDDNYPDNLVERIEIFDAHTHNLKRETYYGWTPFEKIGDRTYRVSKGKNYKYNPNIDKEEIGDILVTNNDYTPNGNMPHAIYSDECTNLCLEDITLYSGNCFGFFETNGTKNNYIRCKIDRRPPETDLYKRPQRIRSNDADAFHSKFAYVGPQLTECFARYQGDDGINICGKYYMTAGGKNKTIRVIVPHSFDLEVGNELEIMTIDGNRLPNVKIVKIEDGGTISPKEIDGIKRLNQNEGNKKNLTQPNNKIINLTVDKDVNFPLGSIIGDRNRVGSGFSVKNCYFGYNRSRGILIKASDGEVSGNTLECNNMHAVLITPEAWWLESGCSDNVVVKDNTIIGNGHPEAICVTGFGFTGNTPPAGLHKNITIENNNISDCYIPCIYVGSTLGGTIKNNQITNPKKTGEKSSLIETKNCDMLETDL